MVELLHAYNKDGDWVKTQERKSLLKEIREYSYAHGDAHLAVETVSLLLSNSKGEIYVVRRGNKAENPYKYDKTVGGHVTMGETYFSTLYRETWEEIGAHVVLTDLLGFFQATKAIDTSKFSVVRAIDHNPWMESVRTAKTGRPWVKRNKVMIFAGVYDGPLRFVDREATEMKLIQKERLLDEIRKSPEDFTYDLEVLMKNYAVFL